MAINKTWLLGRTQFGRRIKNIAVSNALTLQSSGFIKKAFNMYFEKTQVAPLCLAVPTITGTVAVGQTLTVSDGTWAGKPAPTLSYQWMQDAVNIAGATAKTYVIVAGDVGKTLTCKVTGTNANGTYFAVASPTVPVPAEGEEAVVMEGTLAKPANVVMPFIVGDAMVGQTLTVDVGQWDAEPAPTFSYQWKADSQPIDGETEPNFVVSDMELDMVITVTVVATNSEGSSQRTTAATAAVVAAA